MVFLPLVQRELRAASKRQSTFRVRFWATLIGLSAGFGSLLLFWVSRGTTGGGAPLFSLLTNSALLLCFAAGFFFTADCLSSEKREGTLGLLFLTSLRGHDVVLGKFSAAALNAFYALLALFPVMSIPMLLGGVTMGQFWRTSLALLNALFVSLAIGLCVSTFGRETRVVMGMTFLIMTLEALVAPAVSLLVKIAPQAPLLPLSRFLSPFSAFTAAQEFRYLRQPNDFWHALAVSHVLGWLALVLASVCLPRVWQSNGTPTRVGRGFLHWREGGRRTKQRRTLLDLNPITWLTHADPGLMPVAWLVVVGYAIVVLPTSLAHFRDAGQRFHGTFVAGPFGALSSPFGFLLKSFVAVQATRFFTDARHQRLFEALLCTPVTSQEIVAGQSQALRQLFGPPIAVFVALVLFPGLLQLGAAWVTTDVPRLWGGGFVIFLSLVYCVRLVVDLVAVAFVGMWLALSLKNPAYAGLLTILYVLVLPSFLCWLDLVADFVFIVWATARLQQDLRLVATRQDPARAPVVLLPPARATAWPPVIQS